MSDNKLAEETPSQRFDDKIREPSSQDILLGRGKPFQNHPGNKRMLTIVDKYKRRYFCEKRDKKREIVEEVLAVIAKNGGRFLKRTEDGQYWVQVGHAVCFEKIGHALRSKVRRPSGSKNKVPPSVSAETRLIYEIQRAKIEAVGFPSLQGAHLPLYTNVITPGPRFPIGLYGPEAGLVFKPPSLMPQLYGTGLGLQSMRPIINPQSLASTPGLELNQLARSRMQDSLLRQRRQLDDALNDVTWLARSRMLDSLLRQRRQLDDALNDVTCVPSYTYKSMKY
jgi:hypothetical protein